MKKIYILLILFVFNWQNINAQCYSDRHSTSWFDGWISCETSTNPITSYGDTHWIMYDFGYIYTLYDTKLWNINEPDYLNNGIMDYSIDYSIDSYDWLNLGTFSLNQASGLSTYEGELGPNFNAIPARYVLITPISNYGGNCYGLSEVKFYLDESASIIDEEIGFLAIAYPNPFSETLSIKINTFNPEKSFTYTVYDILGRKIRQKTIEKTLKINTINLSKENLITGIYFIKIRHDNKQKTIKIIKE